MPSIFPTPTLKTLIARTAADFKAELGSDATIRRSFPRALSRAMGGLAHELHGLVQKAVTELHPWTATSYGVLFWAAVLDVTRRAAVKAELAVTVAGTPGAVLPLDSLFVRDDGAEYRSTAAATVGGGGTVTGNLRAVVAGALGNCANGVTLALAAPVSGISPSTVTVTSTPIPGLDEEGLPELKSRYLAEFASPPQGGSDADYEQWTRATPGVDVVGVWVTRLWAGEGTVLVRFTVSGDDPIPTSEQVAAVLARIETLRPVTANVTVAAPATTSWGFYIDLSIETGAVLATVKAAVYSEIRALMRTCAPGGTIVLSNLDAAISRAAGEESHVIMGMIEDGGGLVDADDLDHASGTIPILEDGGITWV